MKSKTSLSIFRPGKPIVWFFLLVLTACNAGNEDPDPPQGNDPDPVSLTIDPAVTYQVVSGFGGANRVFGGSFPTTEDMQKAFGTGEDELGLSIFRVRVPPNESGWAAIAGIASEAQKYGARIIASPWSPPAELKSNQNTVGGYLPEENYEAFAEYLNGYVEFMSSNGVDIYAISIQNEPDIEVSYESCDWTAPDMSDFIKNHGATIQGAKIAAPESFNFNQAFTNVLLNDEVTSENFDIVAGHIYGGGLAPFPLAEQRGKEIWMTEYLLNLNTGNQGAQAWAEYGEDEIWEETLTMLNTIHNAMSNNWNAYVWWYLKRYYSFIGDGTEGTTSGEILKRGYAFSHYSRFVRPGYVRVSTAEDKDTGLSVTAYHGDNKVVAVLINNGATPVHNIQLMVADMDVSSATSYTTALNLDRREAQPDVEEGKAILHLAGKSVTTVVLNF